MSKSLFVISIVALILQSQSRLVCWTLLPLALAIFLGRKESQQYGFAFILGIVADLFSGQTLGMSAIFLLVYVLILEIIKLRFKPSLKINLGAAFVFEILYFVLVSSLHF